MLSITNNVYPSNGLAGSGASYPRRMRYAASLCSIRANYTGFSWESLPITVFTHDAAFFRRYNTVFNPHSITSHKVGHHDIRCQPVADYGDLLRSRDTSFWVFAEILHNFGATAWFFRAMR